MLGIPILTVVVILVIAFLAEYTDSTLGGGYGTILAPLLLLMGFGPLQVVPAILLSEFITGVFAAFMHHKAGNVVFDFRNDPDHEIRKRLGKLGYMPKSKEAKVAIVLAVCSVVGTVTAVVVAVRLPKFYMKLFIGLIVLAMGVLIILKHRKTQRFLWKKIVALGALASFNKGMSGGGYGPLVTSGQVLSGLESKAAVAITSLAEGLTCFVGIIAYWLISPQVEWKLAPILAVAAVASVPLSVYTVKKIKTESFTLIMGITTTCLGVLTLVKVFF